ncbi:hypothetical protein [Modestobacter marinus]|uniref:hypothetical protein n=1 Tax=Modestobacter marinus TaxID=477641 RepID=UPI00201A4D8F|nr:hypothetical protein [Modestobacter marinus]
MLSSARPRTVRRTFAAFAIVATSLTTAACGGDVVDDGVEQNVEQGVDEVEEGVDDAEQEVDEEVGDTEN